MRDAGRSALWVLLVAIAAIAGDRLGGYLCRRVLVASQFRFSQIYRDGPGAEILVIGDSRGVHSFYAPRMEAVTGKRVLNLSYNSMSSEVAEAVLADYLDHHPPPRLVIYEPTCALGVRGLASELRTYAGLSPRLEALYARTEPSAAKAQRWFRLLPYNSEFFLRALVYLRRSDQDWINHGVISAELAARNPARWVPEFPNVNLADVGRTVALLGARGTEVRFVIAPYYRASVDRGRMIAALQRVAPRSPVFDYADALDDSRGFADTIHMNFDGSEALLPMLCRDGVLPCSGHAPSAR